MDTTPGPEPVDERPDGDEDLMAEAAEAVGTAGSEGSAGLDSDAMAASDEDPDTGARDPLRFNHWMKRSATGAVLTGITLGLREALEPRREEPAIMIEASGEPEDPDQPIVLRFDPDSPSDTVAVIRRPVTGKGDSAEPPAGGTP